MVLDNYLLLDPNSFVSVKTRSILTKYSTLIHGFRIRFSKIHDKQNSASFRMLQRTPFRWVQINLM